MTMRKRILCTTEADISELDARPGQDRVAPLDNVGPLLEKGSEQIVDKQW